MKNHSRRIAALSMSIFLAAGVLAGCKAGEGAKEPAASQPNGSPDSQPTTQEERPKVTILTNINVDTEGTDVNDNDYIRYIEEQTGIDIEFINDTSSNYPQKLNTIMTSNNIPDGVMLMGDTQRTDLARFAEEELLLPLDSYIDQYPNLKENIKKEACDF